LRAAQSAAFPHRTQEAVIYFYKQQILEYYYSNKLKAHTHSPIIVLENGPGHSTPNLQAQANESLTVDMSLYRIALQCGFL